MNRFLLFFLLFVSARAGGQAPDADAILRAFISRESSHTRQEDDALHAHLPLSASFLFDTLLPRLTDIHARNPDRMLYIHILRMQANAASGYRNYDASRGLRPESLSLMKEAIRLCYLEGNDYVLAETYFDLAELYNAFWRYEEYLLMLTKAFELADRLGPESFPARLRYSKYGGMAKAAYRVYSFRDCIRYGQQALRLRNKLPAGSDLMPDVYLLDLIGASYKQLKQPDSSSYYYHQLAILLEKADERKQGISFWKAIAEGNIGENYLIKGDFRAALPRLKKWSDAAHSVHDNLNICLAGNALAHWYDKQGNYSMARKHWQEVYTTSFALGSYEYAGKAAEGLAVLYRLRHQPDSAFFYYSRAHQYQDSVMTFINRSGIQAVKARVELENLQHSLENTGTLLRKERQNKWLLLAGIFLLAVVAALSYSRQRLKEKARMQETARLQHQAETDARNARHQVKLFAHHLQEKNTLIESLKDKMEAEHSQHSRQEVLDNLRSYTLVSDEEWEKFRADFTRAYPDFLPRLSSRLPQITPAEERLSALLALGFTHPQVAGTLGIGKDSVTRAKHRLRLRLYLDKSESLEDYLCNILKADTSSKGATTST